MALKAESPYFCEKTKTNLLFFLFFCLTLYAKTILLQKEFVDSCFLGIYFMNVVNIEFYPF